jgi:hypothetical protein
MQNDGNLVIYDQYYRVVWATYTTFKGQAPHKLIMQSDGNLVIYDANWSATWSSGSWNYHICS